MSQNTSTPEENGSDYIMDPGLAAAVEVALDLGKPLLVTGAPGTGKTKLASHIASDIVKTKLLQFNTKTTSKAKDLLYRYDALSHFRDSQIGKKRLNPMDYVQFKFMGKAILEASQKQYVVLVDEIDKAPRDFPNDVLFEFDEMAFGVEEATVEDIKSWKTENPKYEHVLIDEEDGYFRTEKNAAKRPVLILTSNSEKNLPDAFLRRCVYYHIEFPKKERLIDIVEANVKVSPAFTEAMVEAAVDHFLRIRKLTLRKKPATAELVSWVHILYKNGLDVNKVLDGEDKDQKEKLRQAYTVLFKNKEDLTFIDNLLG